MTDCEGSSWERSKNPETRENREMMDVERRLEKYVVGQSGDQQRNSAKGKFPGAGQDRHVLKK